MFLLAFSTDAIKHNRMAGELKTMGILYRSGQLGKIVHIHINYLAANQAPCVIVLGCNMVIPIRRAGNLSARDYALLTQLLQISVYSCSTDRGADF